MGNGSLLRMPPIGFEQRVSCGVAGMEVERWVRDNCIRDHGTWSAAEEVQMEKRRKIWELKGLAVNWGMELTCNWTLRVPFLKHL